jgi:hypothetical protein
MSLLDAAQLRECAATLDGTRGKKDIAMTTYSVTGVTHQVQLNPRACWYTCMQMMVYYFQNQQQQSLGDLSPPEYAPEMKDRFDAGKNPSWAEWRNWATRLGFTALNFTPNESGVLLTLRQYGPIMYSGTWGYTFDGHVVVITGIDTSGPTVFVDDPLETSAPAARPMNDFFGKLTQSLWENPLFVYQSSS